MVVTFAVLVLQFLKGLQKVQAIPSTNANGGFVF